MPFLSQQNFPTLWLWFQELIGPSTYKRRLLSRIIPETTSSLLEVGCSAGNLASFFAGRPGMQYLGIDIDTQAISLARTRFENNTNIDFVAMPVETFAEQTDKRFDTVLYAGILHHNDDEASTRLLEQAKNLLKPEGKVLIIEPAVPIREDGFFPKLYTDLFEQGQFLKSPEAFGDFLRGIPFLSLDSMETELGGASPLNWPMSARFVIANCSLRAAPLPE